MNELEKRVALVTGASRGIGRAIALALAEARVTVAINYRERRDAAEDVADAIRGSGGTAMTFGADVSDRAAVYAMMRDIAVRLGPVDILVNNAGIAIVRGLDDLTDNDFDRTISANLSRRFCARRPCCRVCAQDVGDGSLTSPRSGPASAPVP